MGSGQCGCSVRIEEKRPTLIFSCSGCADVGEIADRVARGLTAGGEGKMFCLAGIGGRVPGIMKTVAEAPALVAIDGCPLDCAASCLAQAGFTGYAHVRLTDGGFIKGQSPATDDAVTRAMDQTRALMRG